MVASQVGTLPNDFLVDVVLGVRQLRDGLVDHQLERELPGVIQLF